MGRVARGGSWRDDTKKCRSPHRNWFDLTKESNNIGFRVVLALPLPVDVAGIPLVKIPPGELGPEILSGDLGEKSVQAVKSSQKFWIGETEVTEAQWSKIMGGEQSDSNFPVTKKSLVSIQKFITKLNSEFEAWRNNYDPSGTWAGFKFRLPTDKKWEYAYRAGTSGPYFCKESNLDRFAWSTKNSYRQIQKVREKNPNPWGLYDIGGNVWELVDSGENILGESVVSKYRGGSTYEDVVSEHATVEGELLSINSIDGNQYLTDIGFRVVLAPSP